MKRTTGNNGNLIVVNAWRDNQAWRWLVSKTFEMFNKLTFEKGFFPYQGRTIYAVIVFIQCYFCFLIIKLHNVRLL